MIRFCVCAEHATDRDIVIAYEIISQTAQAVLRMTPIHESDDRVDEPAADALVEEDELELLEEQNYDEDLILSPTERKV